jgi:hypothetical protein
MSKRNNGKVETAKALMGLNVVQLQDDAGKTACPTLTDLLSSRWRDGHMTRQSGRLTLRQEGSGWLVTIDCPTEGVQARIRLTTLLNVCEQIESLVASGHCQWTPDYISQRKARPRVDG